MLSDGMKMAAEGMKAMSEKQDIIAANLANVGTTGFKKDEMLITSFSTVLNQEVGYSGQSEFTQAGGAPNSTNMRMDYKVKSNLAAGSYQTTNNPFDIAIDDSGKNFFVLQANTGEIYYTRNGTFKLDKEGFLTGADGSKVMGENGPVKLSGSNLEVKNDGKIYVDGKNIENNLKVVTFSDPRALQKKGEGKFISHIAPADGNQYYIKQGVLEGSNVNAVLEMVNMMSVMRAYEANQKVLQMHDQMAGKAIDETGRVRG